MTTVERTCRHSLALPSLIATPVTMSLATPPLQNRTQCTRTISASPLEAVHSPSMFPRSLPRLLGSPSEDVILGHPRRPRSLSVTGVGTLERGTTGNIPGKLGNAATPMMSRSFLRVRPVYLGSPTTIRSTRLSQVSADMEKLPPRGFVPGNRSHMSRYLGIMLNQPLINLPP